MTQNKQTIAVFFGGRSPEHDVSIVSGLQVMSALDTSRFEAFPVYISPEGQWYVGDILRERSHYMLSSEKLKRCTQVTLDVNRRSRPALTPLKGGLFGGAKPVAFDVAILAFHGNVGEDGNMQGLLEAAGVPYTGMRTMGSAVLMDKVTTKHIMNGIGIPCLPYVKLSRPASGGYMIPAEQVEAQFKEAGIDFPVCIKPVHLGSSIGVARAENVQELQACMPAIFEFDTAAIVEPFVENLVEYNVAVGAFDGMVKTSAIERPKTNDELLDFKQKYLSGGDGKSGTKSGGTKQAGTISEGMLSLTRELNPDLSAEKESDIRAWAEALFTHIDGSGAPRIDFIGNAESGEIWMNEVNPIPGSFGYFLWEAAEKPILFTQLLSYLIDEALALRKAVTLPSDPVPKDARIHKRV